MSSLMPVGPTTYDMSAPFSAPEYVITDDRLGNIRISFADASLIAIWLLAWEPIVATAFALLSAMRHEIT